MLLQQSVCLRCMVQGEDPSSRRYQSLLIAFWSDAPGGKVFKILAVIIMLFTLLHVILSD